MSTVAIQKSEPDFKVAFQLVAGATSGAITKTCIAGLDRIKILHQIQGMRNVPEKYHGVWNTGRVVVQEEGFRSLWKGNGANVLRVVPVYALKFMFNDLYKDMVRRPGQKEKLSFGQLIVSGSLAGLSQIVLTYPLELVRTRLALSVTQSGNTKFNGIGHCFQMTVKTEGFRALYKGLGPTLVSGTPYVGIQMTCYDLYKGLFESNSILMDLASGAAAGLTAQTLTYPGDTLRRRMQTNGIGGETRIYKDSFDAIRQITLKEGFFRGFYKGLRANMVACIPGAAIQFVAYDSLKKVFGV